MPSGKSQRMLRVLRAHRQFFQNASKQVLNRINLPGQAVADLNISGTRGLLLNGLSVPTLLVSPRRVAVRDSLLLHFHGGAYVSGNLLQARMVLSPICTAARLAGVTFAYRLAPDYPYPAQLEDALEVYRMILQNGIKPERIGFVGESAGGNLALALTLHLRELGEPMPGALALLSPWTDLAQTGESYTALREVDATLDAESIYQSALSFAGGDAQKFSDPMLSPIYADFWGFPPTHIQVGESELLLSDSQTLAMAMRRDGVSVSLISWAGMPHVFQAFGFPESQASVKSIGQFLQQTLTPRRRNSRYSAAKS